MTKPSQKKQSNTKTGAQKASKGTLPPRPSTPPKKDDDATATEPEVGGLAVLEEFAARADVAKLAYDFSLRRLNLMTELPAASIDGDVQATVARYEDYSGRLIEEL